MISLHTTKALLPLPSATMRSTGRVQFSRHTPHLTERFDCVLVIPAHKESARLPKFLRELVPAIASMPQRCRILIVDDGSGAEEQAKLEAVVADFHSDVLLPPLLLKRNGGKGAAVRAGWKCGGESDWVAFVDADGAISATEVRRLLDFALAQDEPRAVFGSRVKMLGKRVERTGLRHLMGRFFAFLVGITISPEIYDSQCGVKLIPAAAYREIADLLKEDGFCFDVELLAALLARGVEIVEVPIHWSDRPGSKVSIFKDTARMFLGLDRIRRRRTQWTS